MKKWNERQASRYNSKFIKCNASIQPHSFQLIEWIVWLNWIDIITVLSYIGWPVLNNEEWTEWNEGNDELMAR